MEKNTIFALVPSIKKEICFISFRFVFSVYMFVCGSFFV